MTNLNERLDKHLSKVNEGIDTYEGVKILVNPSIKELSLFCKQNKETQGITIAKFDNRGKPIYQNALFFNKKDGGRYVSSFALEAAEKVLHTNWDGSMSIEFELDSNMNSRYCSAFSLSHEEGMEMGDGILEKSDGIMWANYINNLCNRFGIKLSSTGKRIVDNWLHGKYSDGEEIPDEYED